MGNFLTINDVNIDIDRDSWDRSNPDIQSFQRTEGFSFEGALYSPKREWSAEMPWDANETRCIALRDWMRGRGHNYTYERVDGATTRFSKYSTDGGPGFSNVTQVATSKFGTWGAQVASGVASAATFAFGSEGRYGVSVWKMNRSAVFDLCSAVYDGVSTIFYAGASAAVTTSFAWMTLSAVSGVLSVTLSGKDPDNNSTTGFYDSLWVTPYQLTTPMLVARAARTAAEPGFPHVAMNGDCLEDLNELRVKVMVEGEKLTQIGTGATAQFARAMKLRIIEK